MSWTPISARDNPHLQRLRKLAQDGGAYRKLGGVWLEGDHLARAAVQRGVRPALALITDEAAADDAMHALADHAGKVLVVSSALFKSVSGLESPARIGFELSLPAHPVIDARADS
ncbi:MAG: RNA methyltransferase, partial [Burkholderiaceae bacterium]